MILSDFTEPDKHGEGFASYQSSKQVNNLHCWEGQTSFFLQVKHVTVIAFLLSLSISDPQPAEALNINLLLLLVTMFT